MPITATTTGAPAGIGGLPGAKVSGRYYGPPIMGQPGNGALGAANRLYALPIWIASTSTALNLSFRIGTGIAGAWNARCGIYRSDANGLPNAIIPNTDTLIAVAGGGTTGVQTGIMNGATGVVLGGGAWYWLAFVADTGGTSLYSTSGANGEFFSNTIIGSSTANEVYVGNGAGGVYVAHVFAALPSTFGTPTYNNNAIAPYVVVGF